MSFQIIPIGRMLASAFLLAIGMVLSSCSPDAVADPFDDSGELIALSGGDAGAQAACHTCHGLNGGGDGALVPRIAGLDSGYLVRQMLFFAEGQRKHPQMSWLSARLDSEERLAVSQYYADMPMPLPGPLDRRIALATDRQCDFAQAELIYQQGIPERGLQSCAACHGPQAGGLGAGNPSLAGQSGAYLAEQLKAWRQGRRYGDPLQVMHEAASKLREDEIRPLADYIAHDLAPSRHPEFPAGCP